MKPILPSLLLLSFILLTHTKTIYISNLHPGTGNGTIQNPYRNISHALDHYSSIETHLDIAIQPSTYNEDIELFWDEDDAPETVSIFKLDFQGAQGDVQINGMIVDTDEMQVEVRDLMFSERVTVYGAKAFKVVRCVIDDKLYFGDSVSIVAEDSVINVVDGSSVTHVEVLRSSVKSMSIRKTIIVSVKESSVAERFYSSECNVEIANSTLGYVEALKKRFQIVNSSLVSVNETSSFIFTEHVLIVRSHVAHDVVLEYCFGTLFDSVIFPKRVYGTSSAFVVRGCIFEGGVRTEGSLSSIKDTVFRYKQVELEFESVKMNDFVLEDIATGSYPLRIRKPEKVELVGGEVKNCVQSIDALSASRASSIYITSYIGRIDITMKDIQFKCNSRVQAGILSYPPPLDTAGEIKLDIENVTVVDCIPTCEPGSFSEYHILACQKCSLGQYSSSNTSTECSSCPPGYISANFGSTSCDPCPSGRYAPNEESTFCSICPLGTYASSPGSSNCTNCLMGTVNDDSTECKVCPAGTYFDYLICIDCPFYKTSQEGSDTCSEISTNGYIILGSTGGGVVLIIIIIIIIVVCACKKEKENKYSQLLVMQ
eukprot:TRINITY_DN1777_c0_g1_i1.p1 TRINITY_DN1777_c0_g1~~TRINITY_DN1777_c0_g1_i1.p1  ORF type:complete len:647 (+),score=85.30 TRINITY_DN1777_c0_g1_i1:149-1942(+)